MDARQLEELRGDLVTRGLPFSYADRIRRELADHGADQSTGQSHDLVSDSSFTDFVVHQYRSTRLAGRHPWLFFVLAPIPVAIIICTLFHFVAIVGVLIFAPDISDTLDWNGQSAFELYPVASRTLYFSYVLGKWLPLFATTYLFAHLHQTSGRVPSWLVASVAILVLFGTFGYVSDLQLPCAETREGEFSLRAFSLPTTSLLILQVVQGLSPLSVFFLRIRRKAGSFTSSEACLEC